MVGLTANFEVLIVVSVMFAISLGGAYILFRLLESHATIQKAGYKAGGALAGFLIILGMLFTGYHKLVEAQDSVDHWTIVGTYQAPLSGQGEMIEVQIIPPLPRDMLPAAGTKFRLANVQLTQKQVADGVWPELEFSAEGLLPTTVLLNKEDVQINWAHKRLEIKKLIRLPGFNPAGDLDDSSNLRADASSAAAQ